MKPRLQTSLGQALVMTPQLRQAIRLLQMSTAELETEIAEAVESNPLLEWAEDMPGNESRTGEEAPETTASGSADEPRELDADWAPGEENWAAESGGHGGSFDDDDNGSAAERVAETETLHSHLQWQLHLSPLSPRDRRIGMTLIDALDDDGYLRTPLAEIAEAIKPDAVAGEAEILAVLHQLQRFDPVGVGARDLCECLRLQLGVLADGTAGKDIALRIAADPQLLERLPRGGAHALQSELKRPLEDIEQAIALLRSLDPKPGAQIGALEHDTYVVPDCVVWKQKGVWKVALSGNALPKIGIHRGYEKMIRQCSESDGTYLKSQLQEARWLLKSIEARGDTLLKVMRCLLRQQAAFLEFGDAALRPLTLREVAEHIGLHESTVSRAIARKYARTPRGTLPLKAFFASGVGTEGGGEASSTAIQSMIKKMIDEENPRKPLSDAKLTDMLKASGIVVARRTVAKYREAMDILSSHERVRMG